jgi:hypothetical protein
MAAVFRLMCRKQFIIINLLLIKNMLLLNSIMEFVCIMAWVFRLICRKQSIITNLLLIKDFLMLSTSTAFASAMAAACRSISHKPRICSNSPPIKNSLLLEPLSEQGIAEAQYRYAIALLTRDSGHRDFADAVRYLQLSAENGNPDGQFAVACMAENGIVVWVVTRSK